LNFKLQISIMLAVHPFSTPWTQDQELPKKERAMKQTLMSGVLATAFLLVAALPARAAAAHFQGDSLGFSHTVDFDATRPFATPSSCASGAPSFAWNFGDGSTTTGNPVSHVFGGAGAYTVTLTVTCPEGTVSVARGVCFAFGFPGCIVPGVGWN
jgi:large repetitive protein